MSKGFPRQEYWSGLPFPAPGDLPDPGIEPGSPALQLDSLPSEPLGKPNFVYTMGLKNKEIRRQLMMKNGFSFFFFFFSIESLCSNLGTTRWKT